MGRFGGSCPFPSAFGGSPDEELNAIIDSQNAQLGSAYNTEPGSQVYVESVAIARGIWAAFGTNQRLGYLCDPWKMPKETIPKWETILFLPNGQNLKQSQRRARIAEKWARFGKTINFFYVDNLLREKAPDVYVQIEHISYDNANIHVPEAGYPFGTVATGSTAPWSSSICHVLVLTEKPAEYTELDFYKAVGAIPKALDPILPVWATVDWYRRPESTPITVIGGPSQGGFYLDDAHNLDNNVFDE